MAGDPKFPVVDAEMLTSIEEALDGSHPGHARIPSYILRMHGQIYALIATVRAQAKAIVDAEWKDIPVEHPVCSFGCGAARAGRFERVSLGRAIVSRFVGYEVTQPHADTCPVVAARRVLGEDEST